MTRSLRPAFAGSGIPSGRNSWLQKQQQFHGASCAIKPTWLWHVRQSSRRFDFGWLVPTITMSNAELLVDELLSNVATIDGGPSTSANDRSRVDKLVLALSDLRSEEDHLSDPKLFDNYSVAYTSSSPEQARVGSAPAGGRFRGRIGRLLFLNRGIFQHIYSPNTVVNLVAFKLLGVLQGAVGLKGTLTPLASDENFGANGVQVDFEPPRISLGRLVFQFGPRSIVKLKTTYLDDRVRIGIGSRGSLFVFTKGEAAHSTVAQEWKLLFSSEASGRRLIPIFALPAALVTLFCASAFSPIAGLLSFGVLAAVAQNLKVTYGGTPMD